MTTAISWQNRHAPDCSVIAERLSLVAKIREAEANGESTDILMGAVAEYDGNGDQEIENCDCGGVPFREILVHLNVSVPATDTRSADEIADALNGALEVGSDDESVSALGVVIPLAEEVG